MTAEEVLRSELEQQGAAYPNAGALVLITALKKAGIALVELPRGSVNPDAWANQLGGVTLRCHTDLVCNFTAKRARNLAAALLAAADAAESSS